MDIFAELNIQIVYGHNTIHGISGKVKCADITIVVCKC